MNKEEKKLLLELIGNEQIHMLIKDSSKYDSEKYKKLEELKIKIKDMKEQPQVQVSDMTASRLTVSDLFSKPKKKRDEDDDKYDEGGCVDAEG